MIAQLTGANAAQLSAVSLDPSGGLVEWDALDVDLSVPGLLAASVPRSIAARQLGGRGGRSTSDAKASAARSNGAKGGRPRKAAARK